MKNNRNIKGAVGLKKSIVTKYNDICFLCGRLPYSGLTHKEIGALLKACNDAAKEERYNEGY